MSKGKAFNFIKSFQGNWNATKRYDDGMVDKSKYIINLDQHTANKINFKEFIGNNKDNTKKAREFDIKYDPEHDSISKCWEYCSIPLQVEISKDNYVQMSGGYELWGNSNTITYRFSNEIFLVDHIVKGREHNYTLETTFIREDIDLAGE